MRTIAGCLKSVLFRLKWAFMSPEARYAYLWERTRRSEARYNARAMSTSG